MNKEWSEKNKNMQSLLKKATFSEGIEELINLRSILMDEVNSWKYEVEPEDYSKMPFMNAEGYHSKTIAYSIWHIARIEDIVVNSLIRDKEEVLFTGGFIDRIKSSIITTGNELKKKEISVFSKSLDLATLFKYIAAVKDNTDEWLRQITYDNLKVIFSDEDKKRLQSKNVVSTDKDAYWLIDYWCKKDVKGLIKMPLSRHWIIHIEAAIKIKDKLEKINNTPRRKPIIDGITASGIRYSIFEDYDGSICVSTLCNRRCIIAKNINEYNQISHFKLESMIYNAEMSIAR